MRPRRHTRPPPSRLDPALVEAIRYIAVPAFVVSAHGDILTMNPAGHAWLEQVPVRSMALTRAGGPDPELFRVTKSCGGNRVYSLVVLRHVEERAAELRVPTRWGLTRREHEVAACIVRGVTNQQIAVELGCANATVERHVTSILRKANVENRASLIVAIMTG